MSHSIKTLEAALHDVLGSKVKLLESALGELTLTVSAADYHDVCAKPCATIGVWVLSS